ncbi:MAG: dihydrofolate reductase family protein [Anaeroplasmataceae bacterium]
MRPFIVCFMMSSLDGRIDCEMTEKIEGSKEYYEILEDLSLDACLSGKITAKMHYALATDFHPKDTKKVLKEDVFHAITKDNYSIVVDTNGTLCWPSNMIGDTHLIVLLSENTTIEYLSYLKEMNISYIVSGKEGIDLNKAIKILYNTFKIKRLGVVGGGKINASFLQENIIDEIDVLIGPGIDGRSDQPSIFDGIKEENPYRLKLIDLKKYDDGVVLLKYNLE